MMGIDFNSIYKNDFKKSTSKRTAIPNSSINNIHLDLYHIKASIHEQNLASYMF